MSGRYTRRRVDLAPSFTHWGAVYLCAPDGRYVADVGNSSGRSVDEILGELNALLDRAEKAEARVAELEAQVAAWSPARCYGEEDEVWDGCPKCGPSRVQRSDECYACGWTSDPVPIQAKTAPKTPVPAPEPTETVQNQAPAAGTDPSRHDPPARGVAVGVEPAPALGDPRGFVDPTSSYPVGLPPGLPPWDGPCLNDACGICADETNQIYRKVQCPVKRDEDKVVAGYPRFDYLGMGAEVIELRQARKEQAKREAAEAEAFKIYEGMIRNPGPPQRALTAEEADAWTERLGKFGSTDTLTFGKVPAERPVYGSCRGCKGLTPDPEIPFCAMCVDLGYQTYPHRPPDVSGEVGLMGALQDRIHKEAGPYRAAKAVRVEASPSPAGPDRWEGLVASEYPPIKFRHEPHGPGTACVVCDNTDPRIKFRVEASPAAAAEVEARAGAYIMQSGGVVTISAIDGVIVEVRHPRAGLPSRDEVAAFLEARWPK